jgi:hypothetical protein
MADKLKKLTVDIAYIDPVTMQKVCSFNQCVKKFTLTGTSEVKFHKRIREEPYIKIDHFHVCNECGRKHRSKKDKSRNVESYYAALMGSDPRGEE